jgi:hypothetical protein|uniref:Cyclophilin TM1367-like domain-containing protein n=1 Tax=uncultured marine thaumarchaeote KM3_02_H10 TaxID=1455957 RepID=A0A075G2R8_9ARCH|nr:hypothetical protein [uncultured marine thaumarchaeote KM3_02_H10]
MCPETVSKIDVILEVNGRERIKCQLKRHLSPMTVGLITRMLPLEGNVHQMGRSIMYFETGINSGIERKRTDFKKGDIAFLPTEGSICFYMDDISDGKPMTIIGKIIDGIEKLSGIKSGDTLLLSRN